MSDRPKERQDGHKGMPSYEREAQALREKTERLRALRLARDGVDAPVVSSASPASSGAGGPAKARGGKAPARGKGSKASGTLSDWLKSQQDQGRRS